MTVIETVQHDVGSLFQSLVEDVARRIDKRRGSDGSGAGTVAGRRPDLRHPLIAVATHIAKRWAQGVTATPASMLESATRRGVDASGVWHCVDLASRLFLARIKQSPDAQQIEDELKFSTCDPEWIEAITRYLAYFGVDGNKNPIPYVRYQDMDDYVLDSLPANARIALIGDWGTGTEEARRVLEQVARHEPDVLIHIGDIYYAGTPDECQDYFLDLIDQVFQREQRPMAVYTLSGNHDMYCGGVGYYALLPQLNPPGRYAGNQAQQASYFALRNEHWQLLAMDTGLHDHDVFTVGSDVTWLDPEEEAWHVDKIRRFSATGGRSILLSHHQLFTAFDPIGKYADRPPKQRAINPKLMASYEKFAQAGEVAAWFWGHEHNLCVYQPYRGLAKGRCIGHGAIPVAPGQDPYGVLSQLGDDYPQLVAGSDGQALKLAQIDGAYAHGFVLIELDAVEHTAIASYYQETSELPIWQETL